MFKTYDEFYKDFCSFYNDLYDGKIKGDYNLVDKFTNQLQNDLTFKKLVGKFCDLRGDFISSDRECIAFMLALDN